MVQFHQFPCGCQLPIIRAAESPDVLPLMDFDPDPRNNRIYYGCKATWDMVSRGETKGVFQLESGLGRQWARELKPSHPEHMSALGALLRPGCLAVELEPKISMTKMYCLRKNGERSVEAFHPMLDPILKSTYQVLTYQEQSMRIGRDIAGFDLRMVDRLRKGIGKKDQKEMAEVRDLFIAGAKQKGVVSEEIASTVWGWIQESGRYQFNKCISGDTVIRRAAPGKYGRADRTVAEMYRIRHDATYAKSSGHEQLRKKWKIRGNYGKGLSLGSDGRIRPNIIVDIQPAGHRIVYKLTLANNATIRVTGNHKFPTDKGEQTVDQMLDRMTESVWSCQDPIFLFVCGDYEPSDFARINRFSSVTAEEQRANVEAKAVFGCFGKSNYAYTNGSFTEFVANNALIPRVCEDCKTEKGRLELHHRDGNRADSSRGNLTRLCSSCHKKREYAVGRIKRGEKGYPSLPVRLVKIEPDGEEETFDVEMAGPNHNFVVGSGIVTCNSHSFAYGILGYITAYCKLHFPVQFFTSWIAFAHQKAESHEEVADLIMEAKLYDVPIKVPDIRVLEPHSTTDFRSVTFGLADTRGVGEGQVDKLKAAVAETEAELGKPLNDWSWFEFLTHFTPRSQPAVLDKLARVGAFSCFNKPRSLICAELEKWAALTDNEQEWIRRAATGKTERPTVPVTDLLSGLKALALPRYVRPKKKSEPEPTPPFGGCSTEARRGKVTSLATLLEKPPSSLQDWPNWIAATEEELLGVSVSCTRVDALDTSEVNTTCKDFLAGRTGYMVLGVEVKSVREVACKNGKSAGRKMAFLTICDSSCALGDVVVFSDAWKEFRTLLVEGNCVLLQGERNLKKNSLIVKRVFPM